MESEIQAEVFTMPLAWKSFSAMTPIIAPGEDNKLPAITIFLKS
jgi:hypothetical protein